MPASSFLIKLIAFAGLSITASLSLHNRSSVNVTNLAYNNTIKRDLEPAATTVDRLMILKNQGPSDAYFKYNFHLAGHPKPRFAPNRKNFPALIGLGVALLMIAPGGNVKTGFIQEEGFTTELNITLNKYEGAIFPMGSIHYEFNDSCEPAVFIAASTSDDPGLGRIALNFFGLKSDILDAGLGFPSFLDQTNIVKFTATIPSAFALTPQAFLVRYNITY